MGRAINIEKYRTWAAAGLLFLLSYPMWMWTINQLVMTFLGILMFVISFPMIKTKKKSKWLLIAFILQILFILVFNTDEKFNIIIIIIVFFSFFSFSTIFLCDKNYWKSVIDKFIIILAVFLIPALIEFIAISFLGINTPYYYITECPWNPNRDYYIYNFNAYFVISRTMGMRFLGFYDEPGVVGNIIMVLLYIQKFNLKKWYNIVLLIAGFLSFSLTFYLVVIGYYIVMGGIKTKISFLVVAISLVALFYDNPIVEDLLFSRMVIEDGQLSGYNRESVDFDLWFSQRSISDFFLWGYSGKVEYAASWKWALVKWGIVPCFLYLISIFMNAIRMRIQLQDLALVLIILVVVFVQRPFLSNYLYVFLIVIPQFYFSAVHDIEKQNRKV